MSLEIKCAEFQCHGAILPGITRVCNLSRILHSYFLFLTYKIVTTAHMNYYWPLQLFFQIIVTITLFFPRDFRCSQEWAWQQYKNQQNPPCCITCFELNDIMRSSIYYNKWPGWPVVYSKRDSIYTRQTRAVR